MIIKSVELENIRSYVNCKIDFNEGINFLSGDIGSGKSSILQAIEFALFGFKRGDLEGFQLLRKGEKTASIKLVLLNNVGSSEEEEVEIFRSLKKSKSSVISQENGYVNVGDNLVELSPQELNSYVFNLLGFPLEFLTKDKNLIYRFTIYTPQEQLKEILFTQSDKRLEIIRKIFQIDKYKQLIDGLNIYFGDIRDEKKVMNTKIEPMSKLKDEVKSKSDEVKILEKESFKYIVREKEFNSKLVKYKDAIDKRELLIVKIQTSKQIYENKITKIKHIEELIISIEKKREVCSDKLEIIRKEDFKKVIDDKQKEINGNILLVENINEDINVKEKFVKDVEKLKIERDKLNEESFELKSKVDELKNLKSSFNYMLTKCQLKDMEYSLSKNKTKLKNYDKLDKKIVEMKESILSLDIELKNCNKDIVRFKDKILSLSSIDVCDNCMQKVDVVHKREIKVKLNNDIASLEDMVKLKEKSLSSLHSEFKKCEKDFSLLVDVKDNMIRYEEKFRGLVELEKKEGVLNERVKNLRVVISKLESKKNNEKINKLNFDIKEKENQREEIDKLNKDALKLKDNNSKLELDIVKLKSLVKDEKSIEKDILNFDKEIEREKKSCSDKNGTLKKLTELKNKEIEVKAIKDKLSLNRDKIHENLRLISNKVSSINTQIKSNVKLIKNYGDDIFKLEELSKKLEQILCDEKFLSGNVVGIMNAIEKAAFTKYYSEFSEEFEVLFRELIEDNDIDVRLDEEFSPVIEQNGYDTDIKNLSGGEKSSVAIAYRLGLKTIIVNNYEDKQKLSLLILDEPTDGFSDNQVSRLGNLLKRSNLKQIILVSHDEKIESISDSVINIEKVNHESFIS